LCLGFSFQGFSYVWKTLTTYSAFALWHLSTARLRKLEDHAHMYTEITQDKMHLLDRAGTYKHTILPVNFWILLKLAFVKLHPLGGGVESGTMDELEEVGE
jgi:hypothetical protein